MHVVRCQADGTEAAAAANEPCTSSGCQVHPDFAGANCGCGSCLPAGWQAWHGHAHGGGDRLCALTSQAQLPLTQLLKCTGQTCCCMTMPPSLAPYANQLVTVMGRSYSLHAPLRRLRCASRLATAAETGVGRRTWPSSLGSKRALGRRLTEPHQPLAHVLPFHELSAPAQVHLCGAFTRWVEQLNRFAQSHSSRIKCACTGAPVWLVHAMGGDDADGARGGVARHVRSRCAPAAWVSRHAACSMQAPRLTYF